MKINTDSLILEIANASTPSQLESAWMHYFQISPATPHLKTDRVIREAVGVRGWELVETCQFWHRIPKITRRGNQYLATMAGKEYKSGRWGNGAGYRWVKSSMEEWVKKTGNFRSRDLANRVMDWVIYGMPHRAMMILKKAA